jgi:probable F420-dependent oxidoreductase
MKIRVGFGLGTRTLLNDGHFGAVVDALEDLDFDSLWLSERISGEAPDPIVGMAYAAGRTRKLKFGTSVLVLPGRNPVVLAKELATLDRLAGGRLLPAFGLGVADRMEQQAFGVERGARAAWFDEALPLLRRCWLEDDIDHDGKLFHYEGLTVRPKPVQQPPDVWLGGFAPSELRRVGRLADGWLPSFMRPDDVAAARQVVEAEAAEHGRTIDPEHFGMLIPYVMGELPDVLVAGLRARRPDVDPAEIVANGLDALAVRIKSFVDVGFSKFVVVPVTEPRAGDFVAHLAELADTVLPLQN